MSQLRASERSERAASTACVAGERHERVRRCHAGRRVRRGDDRAARRGQALRQLRGAARHRRQRRPARGHRRDRPVRLGQVDDDPLHQPPRGARRGTDHRRRGRADPRPAQHPGDPPRDGDGVPAVQPVPAPDRARQRHAGAAAGAADAQARGRGAGDGAARARSASPSRRRSTPASCPAVNSSASPSPARWR